MPRLVTQYLVALRPCCTSWGGLWWPFYYAETDGIPFLTMLRLVASYPMATHAVADINLLLIMLRVIALCTVRYLCGDANADGTPLLTMLRHTLMLML